MGILRQPNGKEVGGRGGGQENVWLMHLAISFFFLFFFISAEASPLVPFLPFGKNWTPFTIDVHFSSEEKWFHLLPLQILSSPLFLISFYLFLIGACAVWRRDFSHACWSGEFKHKWIGVQESDPFRTILNILVLDNGAQLRKSTRTINLRGMLHSRILTRHGSA